MKKIFKLFLCLLMFVSFTNITRVFAEEEGEYLSVQDVVDHFMTTNLMRGLLKGAQRAEAEGEEGAVSAFKTEIDSTNHKINLIAGEDTTVMSFDYTDEYISYTGTAPETEDVDFGELASKEYFAFNMSYAILDAMGYENKDLDTPDDDDNFEYDDEFYNQYGIKIEYGEIFIGTEEEHMSGTYLKEFKISLKKSIINNLVDTYGVSPREDYYSMFSGDVVKPTIIAVKKNGVLNAAIRANTTFEEEESILVIADYKSLQKCFNNKK